MPLRSQVPQWVVVALGLWLQVFAARAQSTEPAQAALEQGQWAEAVQLATAALERGSCSRDGLIMLQRVLGSAQAHLGHDREAQDAFLWVLALDPSFKLAADVPVEMRSPYMEARGFWSLHPHAFGARAELASDGSQLSLALLDPAQLAKRVLIRVRSGGGPYVEQVLVPAATLQVPISFPLEQGELEYTLAFLDQYANVIWELGSEARPERAAVPGAAKEVKLVPTKPTVAPEASPRPYYVGATVAFVLGSAAVAGAGVAHHERQVLARQWNSGDCDGAGSTRGQICADQHDGIRTLQRTAIGLYAAGGASLLTGAILLLVAPPRRAQRGADTALRCGNGPGWLGLSCRQAF